MLIPKSLSNSSAEERLLQGLSNRAITTSFITGRLTGQNLNTRPNPKDTKRFSLLASLKIRKPKRCF